jgi:predicted transcriptional regulator
MIFIITLSIAALIQKQKNTALSITTSRRSSQSAIFNSTPYNLLTLPTFQTPLSLEVNVAETSASTLNNSTRLGIYNFIQANPGIQFRGICNQLGISIGLAQFHLGVLKKAGLISFIRDGKYKRFFESKRFSKKQMQIITLLRHNTARNILRMVLERKQVSHSDLAHELSITSQGLTWQMKRLEKEGLIQESKEEMKLIYSLENTQVQMLTEIVKLLETEN